MMTPLARVNKHLRRHVCLGLKVSLTPSVLDRFPVAGTAASVNGDGRLGRERAWHQSSRPAIYWIMIKIPICEIVRLSSSILRHMIEFWNCEIVEIGSGEGRQEAIEASQTQTQGRAAMLTVIPEDESFLGQHAITLEANGFETSNGIWVTMAPVASDRVATLKISRYVDLLTEQRVSKIGSTCFDLHDVAGRRTGTICKTPASEILIREAPHRIVNALPAEVPASIVRWIVSP
jgi:hypothetical protein